MTTLKAFGIPLLAVGAWLITIILINQLLSGTFVARSCTTACVQLLYWTAFAVASGGVLLGLLNLKHQCDAKNTVALIALVTLLLMFLITMAIGTFA